MNMTSNNAFQPKVTSGLRPLAPAAELGVGRQYPDRQQSWSLEENLLFPHQPPLVG